LLLGFDHVDVNQYRDGYLVIPLESLRISLCPEICCVCLTSLKFVMHNFIQLGGVSFYASFIYVVLLWFCCH